MHSEQLEELSDVHAVLVEKPPALSGAAWRRRPDIARLAVGFNWRFHQAIGPFLRPAPARLHLTAVDALWTFRGGDHLFDRSKGGGIVLTSGVHSIDLACHIMGGPPQVLAGSSTDHSLHLELAHPAGRSRISLEWTNAGKPFSVIEGSWPGRKPYDRPTSYAAPLTVPSPMHKRMMEQFVTFADTGLPGLLCMPEEAQWVLDVVDHLF